MCSDLFILVLAKSGSKKFPICLFLPVGEDMSKEGVSREDMSREDKSREDVSTEDMTS